MTEHEIKLKPCPFCGKDVPELLPDYEINDRTNFGQYAVVCSVSEGGCGATSSYSMNPMKAVKMWNRRAEVTS